MISLNPPLLVDQIDESQKGWLNTMAARWQKAPMPFAVTEAIFNAFQTRGWVEGTPTACKLTVSGWDAARRIIGEKEISKTKKKKPMNKMDF